MANTELLEQGTGSLPSLDELERKVEGAVRLLTELRGERDELQHALAAREKEVSHLQEEVGGRSAASDEEVESLRKERDNLLRDRNALALRVEAILKRLEELGLD